MTAAVCVAIICLAALYAQYRAQEHERTMQADLGAVQSLASRVDALEARQVFQFDPKAFDELKSTVDTLRIAQGLRGSR